MVLNSYYLKYTTRQEREVRFLKPADNNVSGFVVAILQSCAHRRSSEFCPSKTVPQTFTIWSAADSSVIVHKGI